MFPNSVTVQFVGDASALESLSRRTLANINPDLTVEDFRALDHQVADNFNQERLITRLTGLFGLLALALASVGLYGITGILRSPAAPAKSACAWRSARTAARCWRSF